MILTPKEEAEAAVAVIKKQIRELARGDASVEYSAFNGPWKSIRVEDVRADGVMLRIDSEDSALLCSPTRLAAIFRRAPSE